MARTCTFTAYAVGKLLELGNAERVNRLRHGGRPFLLAGYLTHPVPSPNAANQTVTDDTWWRATGARGKVYPGDQFHAVHAVPWSEGAETVSFADDLFSIEEVVIPLGTDDAFFRTREASGLILGPGPLPAAIMELENPWWVSRKWEDLVADLVAEVNDALAELGVEDRLCVDLGVSRTACSSVPALPLLPASDSLFAQPIDTADLLAPISGVAYQKFNGPRYLLISFATEVAGKSDVLDAIDLGPIAAVRFTPPGTTGPNWGPDYGLFERILSPTPILGAGAIDTDAGTNDVALCGQDLHVFNANPVSSKNTFDSVHWTRTPESYLVAGEPKRFYRIRVVGRWRPAPSPDLFGRFRKGIEIQTLTTSDSGGTWTIGSSSNNVTDYFTDSDSAPSEGRWAARPDLKVLRLADGTHLYVWTNPVFNLGGLPVEAQNSSACYAATAADDARPASFFLPTPPVASFVTPGTVASPVGSSGFVTEGIGTVTVWFFCDRADGGGVDLYYWNGTAMAAATLVGFPSLSGGDFINAITDAPRKLLFVMQGKTLLALKYEWNPGAATLTCTRAQFVPLIAANYDPALELQAAINGGSSDSPAAMAWLTGPVVQANPGEPDYTAAAAACIVATKNDVQIVSNVAVNIVDRADFEGLSVAAALSDLILLRGYFMITEPDQLLIADPTTYVPAGVVRFRQRLLPPVLPEVPLDLVAATEACDSGTWLETFSSVIVQNTKAKLGPIGSDQTLKGNDGVTFTLLAPPRNAGSTALTLDNPFISTPSFAKVLANLYAVEFAVPRRDGSVVVKDPYSLGLGRVLRPGDWIKYLLKPPDEFGAAVEAVGRILSINYSLAVGLMTAKVA
jgi:hypothetical protein